MIPSAAQLRAAWALRGESQPAAAAAAGVPVNSIQIVEKAASEVRTDTALQKTLDAVGVVFLERDGAQRAGSEPEVELSRPVEVALTPPRRSTTLPEPMTLTEVAAFARVQRSTIWDWMAEGRFPTAIRMAEKVVRGRHDEVAAWFEALEDRE